MKFKLAFLSLILFTPSLIIGEDASIRVRSYSEATELHENLTYEGQAIVLSQLLLKEKTKVNKEVVIQMLKAIDLNMPKFFPNGPFTRNDFIAMAWLESEFRQFEEGTSGEKGIFQIMPDEFEAYGVKKYFYGVNTNTKMAFRVLSGKYQRWKDYKKAIIAYNGVVRLKNGKWSEKYWKAFLKRKEKVDSVLPLK
jgi:hypothetical protein